MRKFGLSQLASGPKPTLLTVSVFKDTSQTVVRNDAYPTLRE